MSNRSANRWTQIALVSLFGVFLTQSVEAQRIQDVGRVEGIRNRQLKGFGLVLGLSGTGDSSKSELTKKFYQSLLKNSGHEIDPDDIRSKNVAVVAVTANVSSWMQPGSEFEVTVSSMGDAKSIENGLLLETRLYKPGAANTDSEEGTETFALAQGRVTSDGPSRTIGRCIATLEGDVSFTLHPGERKSFKVLLDKPDFSTASEVSRAINESAWLRTVAANEMPLAHAGDLGSVRVRVPTRFRDEKKFIDFISRIMTDIRLDDLDAKVIVDERGAIPFVVISGKVRVKPVVLLYRDLEIRVGTPPVPGSRESKIAAAGKPLLIEVMDQLKQNGLTSADMPKIIQLIADSGSLVGSLEIVRNTP